MCTRFPSPEKHSWRSPISIQKERRRDSWRPFAGTALSRGDIVTWFAPCYEPRSTLTTAFLNVNPLRIDAAHGAEHKVRIDSFLVCSKDLSRKDLTCVLGQLLELFSRAIPRIMILVFKYIPSITSQPRKEKYPKQSTSTQTRSPATCLTAAATMLRKSASRPPESPLETCESPKTPLLNPATISSTLMML